MVFLYSFQNRFEYLFERFKSFELFYYAVKSFQTDLVFVIHNNLQVLCEFRSFQSKTLSLAVESNKYSLKSIELFYYAVKRVQDDLVLLFTIIFKFYVSFKVFGHILCDTFNFCIELCKNIPQNPKSN